MKNKINDLQDQLSKYILEQQLLKSENVMLTRQYQRLSKLKQKNSQYISNAEQQSKYKQQKQKKINSHQKTMGLLNKKIVNCKDTIQKLKKLLSQDFFQDEQQKQNIQLLTNVYMNMNDKNVKNVYSSVRCEDCKIVMPPCQYFLHLKNNQCPLKIS